MDRGIAAFLGHLPQLATQDEALTVLSAISTHVAERLGVPAPDAFGDVEIAGELDLEPAFRELSDDLCTPDLLGLTWEKVMSLAERRSLGAHFTPRALAERVLRQALDARDGEAPQRVWDPAAGGGAFLLAAAREIEFRFGHDRPQIVASLYASDLDPVALSVTLAALQLWSGGATRPHMALGDALLDLPDTWPKNFELIVGNPPFLGQLTSDTARSTEHSLRLKERYGVIAAGYVDQAGLFVELGLRHLSKHGALGFVLPQSLLGSKDGEPVRASAEARAHLASVWIDDADTFDASVEVISLVLVADHDSPASTIRKQTHVAVGNHKPASASTPSARSWAPLLAAAQGVPTVEHRLTTSTVSGIATATAAFANTSMALLMPW